MLLYMYSGGLFVGKTYINCSRDLAHPSPNCNRGLKHTKFCVVFNITQIWAARVWKCSKVSELLKQICHVAIIALCSRGEVHVAYCVMYAIQVRACKHCFSIRQRVDWRFRWLQVVGAASDIGRYACGLGLQRWRRRRRRPERSRRAVDWTAATIRHRSHHWIAPVRRRLTDHIRSRTDLVETSARRHQAIHMRGLCVNTSITAYAYLVLFFNLFR